jgi:hypothetical protein
MFSSDLVITSAKSNPIPPHGEPYNTRRVESPNSYLANNALADKVDVRRNVFASSGSKRQRGEIHDAKILVDILGSPAGCLCGQCRAIGHFKLTCGDT